MTAPWKKHAGLLEDVATVGGLVVIQLVYAGNSILLGYLMSLGINPLTLVVFTALATFFILTPVAVYFERSLWLKRVSMKLVIQLILIAVTLFQTIFLKGIELTSPAMATATPGLIFVIAWTVRLLIEQGGDSGHIVVCSQGNHDELAKLQEIKPTVYQSRVCERDKIIVNRGDDL